MVILFLIDYIDEFILKLMLQKSLIRIRALLNLSLGTDNTNRKQFSKLKNYQFLFVLLIVKGCILDEYIY